MAIRNSSPDTFLRCAWLALVLLVWPWAVAAGSLNTPQYHHTAWSMQDGAPADIWALAQGKDGYLWLGTGTGLYRFDGVQFEHFLPPRDRQFASSNITALYTASDGSLWIGFLLGGVSVLRDGQLTHYPIESGTPGDLVMGFAEDKDGAIWTAARNGFRRFAGRRWEAVGSDWGYEGPRADYLLIDTKGTLWVTTGTTIMYLPRGTHKFLPTHEAVGPLASLAQAPDGTLWVSDGLHGTRPLHDVRNPARVPRSLPATDFARLACMRVDDEGVLWGTDRVAGGVMRVSSLARFEHERSLRPDDVDTIIRKRDGLSSDRAIPILKDREGNIWVGTNLGLHRFRYNNVRALQDERLTQHNTYGIAFSPEYGLVVSSEDRLYRVQGGAVDLLVDTDGASVSGIVAAKDGTLWIKTERTLSRLRHGRLEPMEVPGDEAAALNLVSSDGNTGVLVMHDGKGLLHFDGMRWQSVGEGVIKPTSSTAMARAPDGTIWIGYPGSVVARWDGSGQRTFSHRDGLEIGTVTALAVVGDGLLVAGETGLAWLRNDKVHPLPTTPADLLHGVTGIVVSRSGDIWLNGMRGLIQLRPQELAKAIEQPGYNLAGHLFDLGDGLLGMAQQATPATTAISDNTGRLWFATSQGVAEVDPDRLKGNAVIPPVRIRALVAADRRHDPMNGLRLPKGTRDLRVDYTALSLSAPERVRFRYRLDGVDSTWQDAGNRRQAFYTNLGPGRYRFHVIAANDSGVWNPEGASFDFAIEPRFTETWWFAALCLLATAGLLFFIYLLRLRRIAERVRMRLEERHMERERIARELHDTLLQSIQGLVLRFQAVANRIPSADPIRTALERAMDRADEVIAEGRDRVRDLRASMISMPQGLPDAFARVGAELAESHPAQFSVVVEGRLPALDPMVCDEVYAIGREALINAFRHANANRIEVEISCGHDRLSFRFRDDGQGIGDEIQQNGEKSGHWGLCGMRERAKAISAELNIWSRGGRGTEIELVMRMNAALHLGARKQGWRERLKRMWRN